MSTQGSIGAVFRIGQPRPEPPPARALVMSGGDAVTTDTRIDPATTEARCRRLMAERAYLPDAYPHRDKRADLWALIHAELDAWLEANTSPAPDVAASAEPSAPSAATGEGDVFRAASVGEAHDLVTETGHHRCLRCGAESVGAAPALPCTGKFRP